MLKQITHLATSLQSQSPAYDELQARQVMHVDAVKQEGSQEQRERRRWQPLIACAAFVALTRRWVP